jgi:hypothetical protein
MLCAIVKPSPLPVAYHLLRVEKRVGKKEPKET